MQDRYRHSFLSHIKWPVVAFAAAGVVVMAAFLVAIDAPSALSVAGLAAATLALAEAILAGPMGYARVRRSHAPTLHFPESEPDEVDVVPGLAWRGEPRKPRAHNDEDQWAASRRLIDSYLLRLNRDLERDRSAGSEAEAEMARQDASLALAELRRVEAERERWVETTGLTFQRIVIAMFMQGKSLAEIREVLQQDPVIREHVRATLERVRAHEAAQPDDAVTRD